MATRQSGLPPVEVDERPHTRITSLHVAKVLAFHPETYVADVQYLESGGGAEQQRVRVATARAGLSSGLFYPPEEGDKVVIAFLEGVETQAFILCGLFPPRAEMFCSDPTRFHFRHTTGTEVIIDGPTGKVTINAVQDVEANVQGNLTALVHGKAEVKAQGPVDIEGQNTGRVQLTDQGTLINQHGDAVITERSKCYYTGAPHMDHVSRRPGRTGFKG
jgi:phage baseplate assembly protein gpV